MASRSCELACWREASGIADPPGPSDEECSAARCRERARCPQLPKRRHRPLLTHVVVAASRFGAFPRANKTLDRVREIVRNQAHVRRRVLPGNSSLVLFVDNDTPSPAGEVMRAECEKQGLLYERNGDWRFGYQYELGAWRWAVLKVLPTLGLSADTIIYLMQDSATLRHSPLRYPPPASFRAATLLSFPGGSPACNMLGIAPKAEVQRASWVGDTSAALRNVTEADPSAPQRTGGFTGSFGPGFVATWGAARELGRRGFFSMMKVEKKIDEQRSERVIGWFLTHDVGEPCSIAGPFYQSLPQLARSYNVTPRPPNERPISKLLLGRGWG